MPRCAAGSPPSRRELGLLLQPCSRAPGPTNGEKRGGGGGGCTGTGLHGRCHHQSKPERERMEKQTRLYPTPLKTRYIWEKKKPKSPESPVAPWKTRRRGRAGGQGEVVRGLKWDVNEAAERDRCFNAPLGSVRKLLSSDQMAGPVPTLAAAHYPQRKTKAGRGGWAGENPIVPARPNYGNLVNLFSSDSELGFCSGAF